MFQQRTMKLSKQRSKRSFRRASLQNNIDTRNWGKVRESFVDESKQTDVERTLGKTDFAGQNYLHQLCSTRAPIDVVRSCINLCPDLIYETDYFGKSPLHHAVGCGSSPEVISFLLELHHEATLLQDKDGRTPLHVAFCSSDDVVHETESGETTKGSLMSVVKALCEVGQDAVNMEDENGITPLEYAMKKQVCSQMKNFLQKVSVMSWKMKQAKNRSLITHLQSGVKDNEYEVDKSEGFLNRDENNESEESIIDVNNLANEEASDNFSMEVKKMERRMSYVMMMEERKRRKEVPSVVEIPLSTSFDSQISDLSLSL